MVRGRYPAILILACVFVGLASGTGSSQFRTVPIAPTAPIAIPPMSPAIPPPVYIPPSPPVIVEPREPVAPSPEPPKGAPSRPEDQPTVIVDPCKVDPESTGCTKEPVDRGEGGDPDCTELRKKALCDDSTVECVRAQGEYRNNCDEPLPAAAKESSETTPSPQREQQPPSDDPPTWALITGVSAALLIGISVVAFVRSKKS